MQNNELGLFDSNNFDNLPMSTKWAVQKTANQKIGQVMVEKIHSDGRAYLTQTALEHAGTLSALEQHLSSVTPHAAARYAHIVDGYVMGASNRLARW